MEKHSAHGEKDKASPGRQSSGKAIVDNVSITGVKHVFGIDTCWFRRLFWILLLIVMTFVLVYHVQLQVKYFLERNTVETSKIQYYESLQFPAVTICNQNDVRISLTMGSVTNEPSTSTRHLTIYELMSDFYDILSDVGVDEQELVDFQKKHLKAMNSDMTMSGFYKYRGHQMDRLFLKCVFNGHPCNMSLIKSHITDAGLCHTFNGDVDKPLKISHSGTDRGLRLNFNFEQYQYMAGRTKKAGAIILIHDQKDIPNLVRAKGMGVTSGYHTSIGLRITNKTSYGEVYGRCGERELTQFEKTQDYTWSACQLDCLTRFISERCGCVDTYMPGYNETSGTACSLRQTLMCVHRDVGLFPTLSNYSEYCSCKTPCHIKTFQTVVSQVKFSNIATAAMTAERLYISPDIHLEYVSGMMSQDWSFLLYSNRSYLDRLQTLLYMTFKARDTVIQRGQDVVVKVSAAFKTCDAPLNASLDLILTFKNTSNEILNQVTCLSSNGIFWFETGNDVQRIEVSTQLAHELLWNVDVDKSLIWRVTEPSESVIRYTESLILFMNDLDVYLQTEACNISQGDINDLVQSLSEAITNVTSMSNRFEPLVNYYVYLKDTIQAEVAPRYTAWRKDNLTAEFYRDNYGEVEIYFQEMAVTEISERPAYDVIDLFCDFGGCLGLWLGGSLLTVFEIMDLLLSRTFFCFGKC